MLPSMYRFDSECTRPLMFMVEDRRANVANVG